MYNRAEIIDKNFVQFIRQGHLPQSRSQTSLADTPLQPHALVDLFESQIMNRHLDLRARELKNLQQCFYTIGSSGHEGNAVFGKVFRKTDMAFLHYRSGAFFIQRSKQHAGSTPIYDLLLSFMASSEDPISGGRHKVLGSKELFIPPQTSTIASHLPKAVGAAFSIAKARDLKIKSSLPQDSVVLCSFGDASSNHATAQAAFNTAALIQYQNLPLPLVFICEDNHMGISVPTADRWIKENFSRRLGLHYIFCDGLNLLDLYKQTQTAETIARKKKQPVFLHMDTVRLLGHAGSDVETTYRKTSDIEECERHDPLLHSARILLENQILSSEEILNLYEKIRQQVRHVSDQVVLKPKLAEIKEVTQSLEACTENRISPPLPNEAQRKECFQRDYPNLNKPLSMAKLINWALTDILLQYNNAVIFGEDVAQKGGVYNVTDGLFNKFKAKRVFNSPLDETSILGAAIGLAHNGFLPLPEIQFLAYLHNAEDQLRGEAATLAFFSKGQFTNPMVLRIAGLAYQKGFGGHFHNDNSLAVLRDIPGLIIAIPSNGEDAVKMLRTCVKEAYENGRVCVFIEPIALYHTKDLHNTDDKLWSFTYPPPEESIPLGEVKLYSGSKTSVILTYGNGTYLSLKAKKLLQENYQQDPAVIDLRWMAPLNIETLTALIKDYRHVLVVEECRKTGSWGEGLIQQLCEHPSTQKCTLQLYAADDCFIPLGVAATSGLPHVEGIVSRLKDKGPS